MGNITHLRHPVSGKGITRDRYFTDGADIFDSWGGYYISRELWDLRLAEGRSDTARHSFRYVDTPPESLGQGWFLKHVQCAQCGERRKIGISVDQLNRQERWCLRPKTLGEIVRGWFA